MADNNSKKFRASDIIATVMGPGTIIKGSVHIKNSARIDGVIDGSVSSDQDIVIGETGKIYGHIRANRAIIGGFVKGHINAKNKVVLEDKSYLEGNIISDNVVISDGATFNGKCIMLKKNDL